MGQSAFGAPIELADRPDLDKVGETAAAETALPSQHAASRSQEAASVSPAAPLKRAYPASAPIPTQIAPADIRFDFNDGVRLVCPQGQTSNQTWKVRLRDLDTGNILFETEFQGGSVNSTKRYYVHFGLEIYRQNELVFSHQYSAKGREALIQLPVGTLGDSLGWFPYAVKFKEKHGCRLSCAMGAPLIELFRRAYPDIEFLTHEEVKPERYDATYSIGLFFDDKDFVFSRPISVMSDCIAPPLYPGR
jgi:autotransporter strand-loop-strand O-heptosyltransferase